VCLLGLAVRVNMLLHSHAQPTGTMHLAVLRRLGQALRLKLCT
jgi:hypothetical protein